LHKPILVYFKFGGKSPKNTLVTIKIVRLQAGISLLGALRQKTVFDLIWQRNVCNCNFLFLLSCQFQSFDWQRICCGSHPDINVETAF